MTSILNGFCRLCAKKDEFSKNLLEENNTHVLTLIRDFIQITINETDALPTKICLNCEEKLVSFQLFVLECYKVQDEFKKIIDNVELDGCTGLQVKLEDSNTVYGVPAIKSEVKDELTAEDIVCKLMVKLGSKYLNLDELEALVLFFPFCN